MSILIFFVVLFVLVLVHEWGHFIVAKKTGMRVDEFGIGFPPKLFGIKKGETEYTFNLLPIGGFVKIFGEDGADASSSPLASEAGEGGANAVKVANVEGETNNVGTNSAYPAGAGEKDFINASNVDTSRSFSSKSKWAQAAVLFAGVSMNVLLAWLLFVIVFVSGVPTAVEESQAPADARLVITGVLPDSPAFEAGIPVGAIITSYDEGQDGEALTPSAFAEFTAQANQSPMTLRYKADNAEHVVQVNPRPGLIAQEDREAIGVALSLVHTVYKPVHVALYDATVTTAQMLMAITVGIATLLADIVQFEADLSQVAGPVGIVGLVGDAAEFGIASLLMFTAVISLNLAVINLLPFPALDGGRLLFVAIEAATRRPINPVWAARLNTLGFVLLMALMVAITYSDISKIL